MTDIPPSPLRRDCGRLAKALYALCATVSLLILLDSLGPWLVRRPDGAGLVAGLLGLIAPLAYMVGLARLARVLGLYAGHGRFAVTDALAGVGWALTAGAVFQTLAAPGLARLAGHGPGYWIGLDAATIALGALGIALVVFARLFRRAARMETELETIL